MHDHVLRSALSSIAADAVPETIDLWPAISGRLADRRRRVGLGLDRRRVGLAAAMALVLVVGAVLVAPSLSDQSSTVLAADIARHDPQVGAALSGDITEVTVTSVVDQMATVLVQDSRGQRVTVTVDLLHRIVTRVYHGPALSPDQAAEALAVVRNDPRTRDLLERGATLGGVMPMVVVSQSTDPVTGQPTSSTEIWAQVPLELAGEQWMAYVDLTLGRIDQLVDPLGNQVSQP